MRVWLRGDGPLADAAVAAARSLGWQAGAGTEPPDGVDVIAIAPLATSTADADAAVARPATANRAFAWPMVSVPAVQQMIARCPQLGALTDLSSRTTQTVERRTADLTTSLLAAAHDQIALLVLLGHVGGLGLPSSVSLQRPTPLVERIGLHYDGAANLIATVEVTWTETAAPSLDVQAAGSNGVLRIETDPATRLEHNGEPVRLPAPSPVDPSLQLLRDAGVIDMLKTIGAAFAEHRPLAHAFSFEFGRSIVMIADAATRSSAANGTPVPITAG